jgi:hypothetical protein
MQDFAALGAYISAYIRVLVPGVTYLIYFCEFIVRESLAL